MKILIVYTGGTIGSSLKVSLIAPDKMQKSELVKGFEDVDFEYAEPYFILSEQLNGKNITELIQCVGDNLNKGYDGIIVTHGTDTLQYSASALSLAFGDSEIPIVLVSSNYVLGDSRANGSDNFKFAVKFIKEGIGGVFVSYKNTGAKPEIHLGSQLLAHEIYSDDVKSLGGSFGYFEGDKFIKNRDKSKEIYLDKFILNEFSSVLWLRAYAGIRAVDTTGYKAVLLEGYHSGTLPTLSQEFKDFCKKSDAPIFFLGATDGDKYESTKLFEELGIKLLPKISPIYAFVKLWAIADNNLDVDRLLFNYQ